MWLIPFYSSVFPRLKFVHLVRDGRDMAVSANHFLLEMHGDRLLGPGSQWREDPVSAQLALWRIGNSRAAKSGAEYLAGNYLRVRYEDVCLTPVETVAVLFRFLGASADSSPALAKLITASAGIGRWQAADRPELNDVDPQVRRALEAFGYAAN
jgi:sulfotransferase family protein